MGDDVAAPASLFIPEFDRDTRGVGKERMRKIGDGGIEGIEGIEGNERMDKLTRENAPAE
jgi:hypothetical protein